MFVESYIESASNLISHYELQQPLHLYLKAYFKQNKKYGSRDRKYIAELVYAFYRLGKQPATIPNRELMLVSAFIKSNLPTLFFEKTMQAFAAQFDKSISEKIELILSHYDLNLDNKFDLSEDKEQSFFATQLFSTPRVFIRIRKNKNTILKALAKANIDYIIENEHCFSFQSNVKLEEILEASDYVIQDYSSQAVGNFFEAKASERWWDCCTASGGKAIMLLDKQATVNLTVSDVRESIIKNLHQRFAQYNYQSNYISHCIDLEKPVDKFPDAYFDQIICDAPCSGSGTWARSPEQYYFFNEEKLHAFHEKQVVIASEALTKLKKGGRFYYITCSLYKQENEDVVEKLLAHNCTLVKSSLLSAVDKGADCLFVAVLEKN